MKSRKSIIIITVLVVILQLLILDLNAQLHNPIDSNRTNLSNQDYIDEINCPSNRIEAVEIGRQCLRRCKLNSPCENIRKQCLCDGLCGLSCIKPDSVCPDLPKVENGIFSPTTTTFDTKVRYQCDAGYFLYGSQERICQGDEEWSGIPAECTKEREYVTIEHLP